MAYWQQATLDHELRPLYSLFLQEKSCSYEELEQACSAFFERVGYPAGPSQFVDERLGLVSLRSEQSTLLCTGTGCISGMGTLLHKDAGVLSFGPHLPPVWESSGYAIAGRASHVCYQKTDKGFTLAYHTRVSAPTARKTTVASIKDAGFCAIWMNAKQSFDGNTLTTACHFEGLGLKNQQLHFSLFGKGRLCTVAKSQRLSPRSLDRYKGPAQYLELEGNEGKVSLRPLKGLGSMEIIPLAGDESYWGADFLISFILEADEMQFELSLPTLLP